MIRRRFPRNDQRGMALVVALLVLLGMALLIGLLMTTINVDTKIAGHSMRTSQALNVAEAGVAEGIARIRNGDFPNDNNPRRVAQVFLVAQGSVPALGADSVGLATAQPAGEWLPYSTPRRGPDVLTVQYKTNSARTSIYRYDASLNPAIQTNSGVPIFKITATGTRGPDRRQVVTEVIQKPVNTNIHGAIAADQGINFSGNSFICGHNHSADTPVGTKGRPPCNNWEETTGHLPGSWSTGDINTGGASEQEGSPQPNMDHQAGFYAGPWEPIGMSQTDFFQWVGAPLGTEPADPVGITYLDHDNIQQNRVGAFAYQGGDGEGLLYVDGDLTVNGNFNFKGLIYVEGDLKINGTCWILGAMIVKGTTEIKIANGDCTILYSKDAVVQSLAKHGGQFVTLSWREGN